MIGVESAAPFPGVSPVQVASPIQGYAGLQPGTPTRSEVGFGGQGSDLQVPFR